jgi:HSP20 family protein
MTANIIKTKKNGQNAPATSFTGLVDQFFEDNLNRFLQDEFWGFQGVNAKTVPMNLQETDKTYEMDLFAPGLRKEDFHLDVSDEMLTVSYDRNDEKTEKNINWLRQEYKVESFRRSFTLDDTVDSNKITASYDNGILHLTLPKKEHAQRTVRRINIQ